MTPEDLTPPARATFDALLPRLPVEISSRLKCSRTVRRHGSARTVFLFNVTDRHQTGLFDGKYFSYCLGYDPMHVYSDSVWYLEFEANTKRIYQHSATIERALREILTRQCPPSFHFEAKANWLCAVIRDPWQGPLEEFQAHFLPLYEELIGGLHPYLMPIIDSFIYDLSREEREEVIRSRERQYVGPRRRLSREEIREYSRSIPGSWRKRLIDKAQGVCAICRTAWSGSSDIHIDHIVPFSNGGPTVLENLQAVCAPCNLSKGNR